jgi:hypothetical protein
VHAIIIFDEMQNGAIWGHFRVSYNIESSTILMIDKNILKLSKICPSCLGRYDGSELTIVSLLSLTMTLYTTGYLIFILRPLDPFNKTDIILVTTSIESSTILMIDKNILKLSKICPSCLGRYEHFHCFVQVHFKISVNMHQSQRR